MWTGERRLEATPLLVRVGRVEGIALGRNASRVRDAKDVYAQSETGLM